MSILIKGMDIPNNCAECPFRQIRYSSLGKIMNCGIFGGTVGSFYKDDYDVRNIRHPKCPLVEIPKHGRLIDADVFKENMDYICDAGGWLQPVTKAVTEYVKRHIESQTTVMEGDTE